MEDSERKRLEYDAAVEVVRSLTEIRFKLLALVPTVAGAVVVLASPGSTGVELLSIGLLGAAATIGVLAYELRNTQLHGEAAARVRSYEEQTFPGGTLTVVPQTVLGVPVGHTAGVALVYGAALAGWGYLLAWGLLRALDVGHARGIGLVVGAVAGAVAVAWIAGYERASELPAAAAPTA